LAYALGTKNVRSAGKLIRHVGTPAKALRHRHRPLSFRGEGAGRGHAVRTFTNHRRDVHLGPGRAVPTSRPASRPVCRGVSQRDRALAGTLQRRGGRRHMLVPASVPFVPSRAFSVRGCIRGGRMYGSHLSVVWGVVVTRSRRNILRARQQELAHPADPPNVLQRVRAETAPQAARPWQAPSHTALRSGVVVSGLFCCPAIPRTFHRTARQTRACRAWGLCGLQPRHIIGVLIIFFLHLKRGRAQLRTPRRASGCALTRWAGMYAPYTHIAGGVALVGRARPRRIRLLSSPQLVHAGSPVSRARRWARCEQRREDRAGHRFHRPVRHRPDRQFANLPRRPVRRSAIWSPY